MSGNVVAALQAIESDEEKDREQAIPILVESGRPEALIALEKVATQDDNLQLRFIAKEGAMKLRKALGVGRDEKGGKRSKQIDLDRLKSRLSDKDPSRRLRGVRSALAHRDKRAMKYLLPALEREKDPQVTAELCMTVGVLGHKGEGGVLLARLQDGSAEVRKAAVKGLSYLRDPAVYPTVVAMLQDRDREVRNTAFETLHKLGKPRMIALFVRMLGSSRRWPRKAAIRACAKINSPEFVEVLVKARTKDPDPKLRREAVKALVHLKKKGNSAASAVLIAAPPDELTQPLPDSKDLVMEGGAAPAGAHPTEDDEVARLKAEVEKAKAEAAQAQKAAAEAQKKLARKSDPVALDLPAPAAADMPELPASPGSPASLSTSKSISQTLPAPPLDLDDIEDEVDLSEESESLELSTAEVMVGGLHDPDPEVRMENLKEILSQKDRSLAQQLAARLPLEEDSKVLAKLLLAVGKLGRKKDARRVARFLDGREARVRANAVEALAMLGDEKALEQVVPLLNDEDNRTRANAVVALKDQPGVDVMEPLKAMAKHPDPQMRLSAIFAALEIGTTDVDPVLHYLLKDAEQDVKDKALSALNLLEDQRMAPMTGQGVDLDSTQAHIQKLSAWRGELIDEDLVDEEEPSDAADASESMDQAAQDILDKVSEDLGEDTAEQARKAAQAVKEKKGAAAWGRQPRQAKPSEEKPPSIGERFMAWLQGENLPGAPDAGAGVDDDKKRLALMMVVGMVVALLVFVVGGGGGGDDYVVDDTADF